MQMRPVLLILIALILGLTILMPAYSATQVEYEGMLSSASNDLRTALEMEQAKHGSSTPVLNRLSTSLPDSMSVQVNGKSIDTDLSWIKHGVRDSLTYRGSKRVEMLNELVNGVDALRTASDGVSGTDKATAEKARTVLNGILKGKDYKETWFAGIVRHIWKWFKDLAGRISHRHMPPWINKVMQWFGDLWAKVPWLGKATLWILVVAFAAAIVFLVLRFTTNARQASMLSTREHAPALKKRVRPKIESLLEKAEQDARERRYRDAFRNVYLAVLLLHDRKGFIKYTESGTNWEYLRSVKRQASPETAALFSAMTSEFDLFIYGQREVFESGYSNILARFRELEEKL